MKEHNEFKDVLYKDEYVSLIRKHEYQDDTADDDIYYADLLDSNSDFITYMSKEYITETIQELKQSKTDIDICNYLIDMGIADYCFKDIYDINVKKDLLEDFNDEEMSKLTKEELNEYVYENDYVNRIGMWYIRMS